MRMVPSVSAYWQTCAPRQADIEEAFERNELDYGRKLYLIENCICGVDIQPIAVQIAKLRFFISLIVTKPSMLPDPTASVRCQTWKQSLLPPIA